MITFDESLKNLMNIWDEIVSSVQNSVGSMGFFIPQLINACLILIVGWVIAKIVQWIVLRLSHAFGIDNLARKSGVHRFLEKRGLKRDFLEFYHQYVLGYNFNRSS